MRSGFARYLGVAALARFADEGARVALVLLALDRTESPAFGGQLVAALLVPHVVAAPAIGALADRVRHWRAFHAASLAVFGGALALCAVLAGRVATPAVLAVVAAGGCFAPLITGGLSSLVRDLVPRSGLGRAYGLDVVTYNVAGIGGPAVAAVLAGAVGPGAATLALAAFAGAGGLLLGTLPPARHGAHPTGDRPKWTGGVTALWRDRTLRSVTLASSFSALGLGGMPLVAALLAADHGNTSLAGWFISAAAAGGLLGSLGYARRPVRAGAPHQVVLVSVLAMALPLALVPLVPGIAARLVLFGVAGFCTGPMVSSLLATRERHAPEGVRTQVFTISAGLRVTAAAAGAALAGAYAGLGAGWLLLAAAGCHVVGAGVGSVLLPRHRLRLSDDDQRLARSEVDGERRTVDP